MRHARRSSSVLTNSSVIGCSEEFRHGRHATAGGPRACISYPVHGRRSDESARKSIALFSLRERLVTDVVVVGGDGVRDNARAVGRSHLCQDQPTVFVVTATSSRRTTVGRRMLCSRSMRVYVRARVGLKIPDAPRSPTHPRFRSRRGSGIR